MTRPVVSRRRPNCTGRRRRGYTLHFPELHFVLGVWTERPEETASLTFSLALPVAVKPQEPGAARGADVESRGNLSSEKIVVEL